MTDSPSFDFVCEEFERCTTLNALEARGTVRIALKQSGLDARSVTPTQLGVVLAKVMPEELSARGIDDGERICSDVASRLAAQNFESSASDADSPEGVFRRLGGGDLG